MVKTDSAATFSCGQTIAIRRSVATCSIKMQIATHIERARHLNVPGASRGYSFLQKKPIADSVRFVLILEFRGQAGFYGLMPQTFAGLRHWR